MQSAFLETSSNALQLEQMFYTVDKGNRYVDMFDEW
jgi:hypothetical protein